MGKQIEDKGLHLPAPPRGSSEEPQHECKQLEHINSEILKGLKSTDSAASDKYHVCPQHQRQLCRCLEKVCPIRKPFPRNLQLHNLRS